MVHTLVEISTDIFRRLPSYDKTMNGTLSRKVVFSMNRLYRAFLTWHASKRSEHLVQIDIDAFAGHSITFSFQGYPRFIAGSISRDSLNIHVFEPHKHQDVEESDGDRSCLDLLLSLDLVTMKVGSRYGCKLCESGNVSLFQSPEDLWTDHFFNPLQRFINEKLAPSVGIQIYVDAGISSAQLMNHPAGLPFVERK